MHNSYSDVICLTHQSAYSYTLWALQRLYLQPSLLLLRSCMTYRYSSLLAYHKSDSSHSLSSVFSYCFIWNANIHQESNLPLYFLVSHKGQSELILSGEYGFWLTDILHRKCYEIYTASSFTWNLRNQRMNFSRPKWETNKQTNKQILEAWGVCFLSKPTFLLFAFMDMFFCCVYFYVDFYLFGTSFVNISTCRQFTSRESPCPPLHFCWSFCLSSQSLHVGFLKSKRIHRNPNSSVPCDQHWKMLLQ